MQIVSPLQSLHTLQWELYKYKYSYSGIDTNTDCDLKCKCMCTNMSLRWAGYTDTCNQYTHSFLIVCLRVFHFKLHKNIYIKDRTRLLLNFVLIFHHFLFFVLLRTSNHCHANVNLLCQNLSTLCGVCSPTSFTDTSENNNFILYNNLYLKYEQLELRGPMAPLF